MRPLYAAQLVEESEQQAESMVGREALQQLEEQLQQLQELQKQLQHQVGVV